MLTLGFMLRTKLGCSTLLLGVSALKFSLLPWYSYYNDSDLGKALFSLLSFLSGSLSEV